MQTIEITPQLFEGGVATGVVEGKQITVDYLRAVDAVSEIEVIMLLTPEAKQRFADVMAQAIRAHIPSNGNRN